MKTFACAACPICHSRRIYAARVSEGEYAPSLMLQKEHEKPFYVANRPTVDLPNNPLVCLDCGLVWTKIDPKKIAGLIEKGNKLCAEELRLGLEPP